MRQSKSVNHCKHLKIQSSYILFSCQASVDHHVVAVKNREDIPYSRTDIIPVQLLLRLSERRLRRDRIDQPVVFVPGSIDDRPALRCSAVTADLRRPPYKERVRDLALRAMNPVSGILCRAAGDREIDNIRKCTQVPVLVPLSGEASVTIL